jgi:hypothetical protein
MKADDEPASTRNSAASSASDNVISVLTSRSPHIESRRILVTSRLQSKASVNPRNTRDFRGFSDWSRQIRLGRLWNVYRSLPHARIRPGLAGIARQLLDRHDLGGPDHDRQRRPIAHANALAKPTPAGCGSEMTRDLPKAESERQVLNPCEKPKSVARRTKR